MTETRTQRRRSMAPRSDERYRTPIGLDRDPLTTGVAPLVLALVAVACVPKEPEQRCGGTEPPLETSEDRQRAAATEYREEHRPHVITLVGDELRRVNTDGESEVLASVPGATSCDVDRAHRVVWVQTASALSYYDLREKEVVSAITGLPAEATDPADAYTWRVQYRKGDRPVTAAGTADGMEDCAALVVEVSDAPQARGVVVAEGDREVYCEAYFDQESAEPVTDHPLLAQLSQASVDARALVGLHVRREHLGVEDASPILPPSDPEPVVDPSRCEEVPEDCGKVTYLGGWRLYSVVTANSRGDFYHETSELFDVKTARYWDPVSGAFHDAPGSTEPPALDVIGGSQWAIVGNRIIDMSQLTEATTLEGQICGWQ